MNQENPKQHELYLGVNIPKDILPLKIIDKSGLLFRGYNSDDLSNSVSIQKGVSVVLKSNFNYHDTIIKVDYIDPIISRVLNVISFLLLGPVYSIALEIICVSDKNKSLFFPSYTPNSWGRVKALGFEFQGHLPHEYEINHEDKVDLAINWFIRGNSAITPIESYANYWLALETLAPKTEKQPLKMNCCGFELEECPSCSKSTVGAPGMKKRLQFFFIEENNFSLQEFNNFWELRNFIFHGSSKTFKNIYSIAGKGCELRSLVVETIKKHMKIPIQSPPLVGKDGYIVGQSIGLECKKSDL